MKWLKKNYEFNDVFAFRRSFISDNFFFYYKPNHEIKAGVVITKKEGNACERHKIKRQIKNIINEESKILDYRFNVIIKAKNKFLIKNFNIGKDEINKSLEKISKKVK